MKITLMVKSGMVDVVDCPEGVEIILRDYDYVDCANDFHSVHTDYDGDSYLEYYLD